MSKFFHEHNPNVETLANENSLAEWIVDLTTEVSQQLVRVMSRRSASV